MYVRVFSDDGPLKITMYHVTWLPSINTAFTTTTTAAATTTTTE